MSRVRFMGTETTTLHNMQVWRPLGKLESFSYIPSRRPSKSSVLLAAEQGLSQDDERVVRGQSHSHH